MPGTKPRQRARDDRSRVHCDREFRRGRVHEDTLNGTALTATLIDSETTRDFVSLLPLTLTMNDLFGREKFGHLPRAISGGGKRTRTYEVGDVIYWPPGPDVAIYYRHDGQPIPSPGIIVIGKMDSGVEALAVPGSVRLMIELIK